VWMAYCTVKSIEEIKAGDMVLSLNLTTNKLESKQVVKTFVREAEYLHSVTIGSETLYTTAGHPFLTEKGYVDAEELGVGTSLVTRAGPGSSSSSSLSSLVGTSPTWGGASVSGNLRYNPEQVFFSQRGDAGYTVYNFEVEDNHNYFVGKTNGGICVHNANPTEYEGDIIDPNRVKRIESRSFVVHPEDLGLGSETNEAVQRYVQRVGHRTDHAGHRRSNLLGGSGTDIANISPQNGNLNTGRFRAWEKTIANAVRRENKPAFCIVEEYFNDYRKRPIGYVYKYTIDGKSFKKTFANISRRTGRP
jgi:hypothetical protein